jgi:predicted O-linked N-acetylglucosamine transferase (SPINDLY family)
MLPAYREHDRNQFEIYSYSNLAQGDAVTEKFKELSDHWRPLAGLNDDEVADQVRKDGIDILIDLTLHMGGNRLLAFARRPAPVQVTFAGYPGGTGLSAMGYRLTDPYLDPPGADGHYVEKSIRLADSFWCYEAPLACPDVNDLPAKVNGYVTFGCLNGLVKTNADTMALWAKVMSGLPNSRLMMLSPPGTTRDYLATMIEAHGVSRDRIDFIDRLPREQFLSQFNRIDISLDTLPYNGHTTSLESLWMGVPVVSLLGQTVVGRAGWSQLSNLGLGELVALTEKQFVQIAIDLSRDLDRLGALRSSLRDRMLASPLTSALRFSRNLEDAYRTMWKSWVMSQ